MIACHFCTILKSKACVWNHCKAGTTCIYLTSKCHGHLESVQSVSLMGDHGERVE